MQRQGMFSGEQAARYRKIGRRVGIIIGIVLLLVILAIATFGILTKYIWMDTLTYGSVYVTILTSKITLGVVGFLLFFIFTLLTLIWIRNSYLDQFSVNRLPAFIQNGKIIYPILIGAAVIIGFIGSAIVQGVGWEPGLKFFQHKSFGLADPHFNKDISFYMFDLPFIQFVLYTLFNLFFFLLVIQIAAYSVFRMYQTNRKAQIHLALTIILLGVSLAGIHYLGRFDTLLTSYVNLFQESVVHGMSYTDKVINVPKSYILAIAVLIAAIWAAVGLFRGKVKSAMIPIITYIGLFVLSQIAAFAVQNFIVSPNEFAKEEPFLEHNLAFTRAAYDLDSIVENEHPGNDSLDDAMIERNALTIDNIRLNDSRPLLDIYNQLQTFRSYYIYNDMDIDRYMVDGKYEQVFIGARELNTGNLPEQAQTWVNRNLRYTHGYGVAMSHVNKVTAQGQPEFMLKNIPVEGAIDVTRPQVYFGEEDYPNVIVNSKVDEFDYPTDQENATNQYTADTGIPLSGINRLLFAISEGSVRMLVSDQLTKESQLLETRNIKERVERIAPFLTYDNDPYIFIRDDGTLAWIIDAYVTADNYPYSESFNGQDNYIRNSVKVTVDAYTGEVSFYVVDEADPLIQTYQSIFPDLFTTEIPEDVYAHFRYPVDLFKVQTEMYGTYHMSNLEVFYNREDYWEVATEKLFDQDVEMEPYYITMKLPENDMEEFILMQPYTPKNRQNMISWIGVRNDGENYGELFVYRFPKQKNVYGPQQIENRINQDSMISQQLNLWSQGNSEVIRGNLIVIPLEDTLIYVEPIYIESSNETALPEVKQVIMAYEDHIVMEETFEKSLAKILNLINPENDILPVDPLPDEGLGSPIEGIPVGEAELILSEIADLFTAYQEELAAGNWAEAGEIMEEIEMKLIEIK